MQVSATDSRCEEEPILRIRSAMVASLFLLALPMIPWGSPGGATAFEDDFESGTLSVWTIGGRQLTGTNTANVVSHGGSFAGHLFKTGFTEITIEKLFDYDPAVTVAFTMEVHATSEPAPPAYYSMAGATFQFVDLNDMPLGTVGYVAATTQFPFGLHASDSTVNYNALVPDVLTSHSFLVSDLVQQISIDANAVRGVKVRFVGYSSTNPYPSVTAELWVDSVFVGVRSADTPTPMATATPHGNCEIVDADGDGEIDATDTCPNTLSSVAVDQAGCSLEQFCTTFDATTPIGKRTCKKSDWKNDQPLMKPKERDCTVDKGRRGSGDDHCVVAHDP